MDLNNPIFFETPRIVKYYETNHQNLDQTQPCQSIQNIIHSSNKNDCKHPFTDLLSTMMEDSDKKMDLVNLRNSRQNLQMKFFDAYDSNKNCNSKQEHPHQKNHQIHNLDFNFQLKIEHPKTNKITQISNEYQNKMNQLYFQFQKENHPSLKKQIDSKRIKKENVHKRKRKTNQQIKILQEHFRDEEGWTKQKILDVAKITKLTESQVYKWCWDYKKKSQKQFNIDEQHIIEWHNDHVRNKKVQKTAQELFTSQLQ